MDRFFWTPARDLRASVPRARTTFIVSTGHLFKNEIQISSGLVSIAIRRPPLPRVLANRSWHEFRKETVTNVVDSFRHQCWSGMVSEILDLNPLVRTCGHTRVSSTSPRGVRTVKILRAQTCGAAFWHSDFWPSTKKARVMLVQAAPCHWLSSCRPHKQDLHVATPRVPKLTMLTG